MPAPATRPPIHRTPPGPHTGSSPTEGPPQRAFSVVHTCSSSSHTRPANRETSTAALTTPALDRRSLRWFGISACTATPEGTDRADDLLHHHHHFPSGHTVSGGREPPPPALLEPYVTPYGLHGPVRPCAPHRYSRTRSVRCLWFSLLRPATPAVSIGATVPCQRLRRAHVTPRRAFVLGPPTDPSFDAIVVSFRCVSSGSHMFVFSSHTRPANSETSTAALTTPALDRRSLRWFGISACTATPQDLPPSLAQHGSCRRSSTSSSSLPFRTHVGVETDDAYLHEFLLLDAGRH